MIQSITSDNANHVITVISDDNTRTDYEYVECSTNRESRVNLMNRICSDHPELDVFTYDMLYNTIKCWQQNS